MKDIYKEHLSESGRGDLGRKRDQRWALDGGLSRKKKMTRFDWEVMNMFETS